MPDVEIRWSPWALAYILTETEAPDDTPAMGDYCEHSINGMRAHADRMGYTVTKVVPAPRAWLEVCIRDRMEAVQSFASCHGDAGYDALRVVAEDLAQEYAAAAVRG